MLLGKVHLTNHALFEEGLFGLGRCVPALFEGAAGAAESAFLELAASVAQRGECRGDGYGDRSRNRNCGQSLGEPVQRSQGGGRRRQELGRPLARQRVQTNRQRRRIRWCSEEGQQLGGKHIHRRLQILGAEVMLALQRSVGIGIENHNASPLRQQECIGRALGNRERHLVFGWYVDDKVDGWIAGDADQRPFRAVDKTAQVLFLENPFSRLTVRHPRRDHTRRQRGIELDLRIDCKVADVAQGIQQRLKVCLDGLLDLPAGRNPRGRKH